MVYNKNSVIHKNNRYLSHRIIDNFPWILKVVQTTVILAGQRINIEKITSNFPNTNLIFLEKYRDTYQMNYI